ncbi:carboxymuconolactone decarboxylase family protein [Streptomyces sp. NPDC050704]|uniref:carboxymuconolactone decarboxylase family protein n=1 Tax=Streptomyces sp. NPDC050704 TaxID=3157219 RepID=UPI0034330E2A
MNARLNLFGSPVAAKALGHYASASKVILEDSPLPAATQKLVMLRASQINGCGYATDYHSKNAAHAGETPVRINLVAAWRESNVYTDAERAALELTEQGTRIADAAGGVTDEVWANAAKHYDEEQLADLVLLIALINSTNRMGVIIRRPGGDYQPGQ